MELTWQHSDVEAMQAMQRCSKGKQVMKDCLLEQEHVTDNQDLH